MDNNASGISENRPTSGLSLNGGPSFRRSLGTGAPSVPGTPVLSTGPPATVIVNKDNAGYGMKVSGDKPVYVQSVKEGGAAQRAGLHSGDKIIKVNGVDVTHSTHTEVVALIKAHVQVVLTVQQRPPRVMGSPRGPQGGAHCTTPNSSNPGSGTGRAGITGPRPVDNEKMRQLELQRVQTLRMMLDDEQRHLAAIRNKATKRQETARAEARVHTLQEQLRALDAEGCSAMSSHNVVSNTVQPDHTIPPPYNPHFLSRFPRSLSNLSLGGRAKKPDKDSTDASRNKPDKNAQNHQTQQSQQSQQEKRCPAERNGRASLIIDAPPPLPQRNKNMAGWLQEQTSVDHSTDLDHSIDEDANCTTARVKHGLGMDQVLDMFLDSERNASRDSNANSDQNNSPPPLPPRQDRPLPNSIDTLMNYPLVATCAPTLCNNNAAPVPNTTTSHKRALSSPEPVTLSSDSNLADRQTKSSSGSWGNAEATPPGTPPPPYPSPTNAEEEHSDGWNRLHSSSPIPSCLTSPNEPHDRSSRLASTPSGPIQAAQSHVAQQHIISMEDDDISDSEAPIEEHGPFKSLRLLLEHPGHVAVFLNYLFANSQPTSLLFYLITDLYKEGNLKDMRRWAYEIHSTFLVPGAPLHLNNVDETMAREIDDVLLHESDKEEILRKIFLRARTKAKEELTSQLNDFQVTRTVGLGMMFGPKDTSLDVAIGDRSKELRVIETALLSNLDSYLEDLDPNRENVDSKRYATAQALSTVLLRWFRISHGSHGIPSSALLERCPTFVSKEKPFRGKLIGKSRKLVVRGHHLLNRQYYIVTYCNQCHDIMWGVGPQGYHCSDCGLNIHRTCGRVLEEDCPGPPNNPNTKSKQNQTDRRISKLMEKIRPTHHFINAERQQRRQEEETLDEALSSCVDRPPSVVLGRNLSDRRPDQGNLERGEGMDGDHHLPDPDADKESPKPKSAPVSVNRSESYKERLSQRRNMNQRRKTSDPNLSKTNDDPNDINISQATCSGSSSTSSLSSRSLDSPSASLEAVHGGASGTVGSNATGASGTGRSWIGLQAGDSDEGEDGRDWTIQVPPEILATLTDKDKKCQEVINELILTERSHIRTLALLDRVFRAPLQSNAILPAEQFQLLFPASLRRLQEWHGSLGQRLKQWRKEAGPVATGIGELLLGMFDGPGGDELKQAAASFCEHQQIALEGLKERRRKEPRLNQLLNEAESHPACRRLQLKDLLPMACFMRLTKYPLLFENLLKCTEEESAEWQAITKAMDLSKAILNHVNNAVREAENCHKLQMIQKKLDKSGFEKFVDLQVVSDFKNLDLTQYRLVHDGTLILRQQKSELPLHAILLDGLMVLLLKQDDKYIMKFHQSTGSSESGRSDRASPIIKLSTSIVRPLASAKNTFFVIVTSQHSQMYEFATHTEKEYNMWYKQISEGINSAVEASQKSRPRFPFELHSDNPTLEPTTTNNESQQPSSNNNNNNNNNASDETNNSNYTDLCRLTEESETDNDDLVTPPSITNSKETKPEAEPSQPSSQSEKEKENLSDDSNPRRTLPFNMRILTQSNNLIGPNEVTVSSVSPIHVAEPVLTTFEQLRRADTAIHEALSWKQNLVGQVLGIPEEHYAVIADMAPMSRVQEVGEVLLTAIQQAQQLAQLLADSTDLTEEQIMLASQLRRNNEQNWQLCDRCNRARMSSGKPLHGPPKIVDGASETPVNTKELSDIAESNENCDEVAETGASDPPTAAFAGCGTCPGLGQQYVPSVPASKLSELVNAVIPTLTHLLEVFKEHDNERESLRKELQRHRELLHHMHGQNSLQDKTPCEKGADEKKPQSQDSN